MTYTIRKGDTVTGIAKKHGVSIEELIEANPVILKNPNIIYPGQALLIPSGSAAGSPAEVGAALIECIKAVENLDEFKRLEALLNGN